MLSRHFLRSKVLQAVYACELSPIEYPQVEREFRNNIAHLNTLGVLQLSMLIEFRRAAQSVIEDGMHKFMPSEAELNPSLKLVDNRFLVALEDNFDLKKWIETASVNWHNEYDLFRKAFTRFRDSQIYKEYLSSEQDDFLTDQLLVLQLFKFIVNEESIRASVVERSLLWDDDYDQIAQYNYMMLRSLDETLDASTKMAVMYDTRFEKDVDDMNFALQLLRTTFADRASNQILIKENLKGWDFERVALMDILLLNMAIAELTSCPTIPERVTIDEYIELSKEFSTDRSKLFINGILDRIIIELRSAGRINKSGRGLMFIEGEKKQ